MYEPGNYATDTVEDEVAKRTQLILDGPAEQPQRPHVQDEMQPSSVQKHHREEG
jgi:hypothetical protein